tara:strand:- start:2603 stop:3505 length:903 start_codon:yes stop_codon:yes gene_type:complete
MKTPGLQTYRKRRWVSISSLLKFSRCERLYYYSSGQGLSSLVEPNYFSFGSAIHKAAPLEILGRHEEALSAFGSEWDESRSDDWGRSVGRAQAMLENLGARFNKEDPLFDLLPAPTSNLSPKMDVSEWEIPIAVDLGMPVPFVARIDGWCQPHNKPEERWIVEYKTSRELSGRFLLSFETSIQLLSYALALAKNGILVNGAYVVGMRVSNKNAETAIHPITFQPHQLEDTALWLQHKTAQLLAAEEKGVFLKDLSGCHPYSTFGSHGYPCDFCHLCHLVEDWTSLKSAYRVEAEREFELA